MTSEEMTNNQFAKKDAIFSRACKLASIPTSSRQASKYRSHRGLAYSMRKEAIEQQVEGAAQALMQKEGHTTIEEAADQLANIIAKEGEVNG